MSGYSTMNWIRGGASSSGSTGNAASAAHLASPFLPFTVRSLVALDFFEI
jgi:hypothetical protein